MKIGDVAGSADRPVVWDLDLEEVYRRRKDKVVSVANEDEAMRKVEEAQHAATQSTFKMMDRHNEMVKKSQELHKAQAQKRALERLTQKRVEEHQEVLAEMAIRNAERHDLLEAARLRKQQA